MFKKQSSVSLQFKSISGRFKTRDMFFIGSLMLLHLFLTDIVRSEKTHLSSEKGCQFVQCDIGEHCVSRKFWCKNPPCPSMIYCSKTPRESMKGPITCASVRCSKSYICMVKVRRCRWDQGCKQQIARCVSEQEYYEGPASCAGFYCASGHRCILRESLCAYPPCKLLKSCANSNDVQIWHERCRTLGCPSEHECFLRKPSDNCVSNNSCKHTPDCTVTNVKNLQVKNPLCRGWVCPRDQQCIATSSGSCNSEGDIEGCRVNRTCYKPLGILDTVSSISPRLIPRSNQHPDFSMSQTTPTIHEAGLTPSHTDCDLNKRTIRVNWDVQFEKWNSGNGSLYRTPVYIRSTLTGNGSDVEDPSSDEQPTDRLTTQWLDHLRLKTGVNALDVWIKQAEENGKYEEFNEWLAAVRFSLGASRFKKWVREIQKLTTEYPAFQKWLTFNEATSPSAENHSDDEDYLEKEIPTALPDREEKPDLDNKRTQQTTESPDHGYRTLKNFHPRVESGNDRKLFSVIQETSNGPLRKNAGHPRINYGQNRGYKLHQEFHAPETKTQTLTGSKVNDPPDRLQTQLNNTHKFNTNIGHLDSPELQEKVPDERNVNNVIKNNSKPVDSMIKLSKNTQNSKGIDNRNLNPSSHVLIGKEKDPHDLITKEKYDQVGKKIDNSRPDNRDQIGKDNGLDHNSLLFTKVKDPKWNFDLERTSVPVVIRPFTEKDQRKSLQGLEFPLSSLRRQYYQRIYELDPKVPQGFAKSWNLSLDIGIGKDEDLTKTYTVSTIAPDELPIISSWDVVRVLDPSKRAYYSLLGFTPEQVNNRLTVRYPLSLDRDQISSKDSKSLVDISMDSKSGISQNPRNQVMGYFNHGERKHVNDLGSRTKYEGYTDHRSFLEEEVIDLSTRSHSTGLNELKKNKSLEEHHDGISSQEYFNAYVNTLIENALSRVIIGEKLRDGKDPENIFLPLHNGFKKKHLDFFQEIPLAEENLLRDKKYNISKDVSKEDIFDIETQANRIPAKNSRTYLITGKTKNRYGCDDGDEGSSERIKNGETKSTLEEDGNYYYEEDTGQEYFQGPLGYQEKYLRDFKPNLTDYDFQYYEEEVHDEISSKEIGLKNEYFDKLN